MILAAQAPAAAQPSLSAQLQSFITGIVSLDPAQAAIRGGLTFLVVFGAALVIWGLHVALKAASERLAPVDGARKERRSRVGRSTLLVARLVVFAMGLIIVLRVWGLDVSAMTHGPIGAALIIAARIALILALVLAAVEMADLAILGVFNRIATGASTMRRASQLRTLAPVLVGVINTSLVVVASMMALSQVGVEIGPLLAGAGIVGVAVGFGAQTIVKDFLTGIFLILEDTVSVGDNVRIGQFAGRVEEMSLRTIKLRDFDGTLHVFPYSEAQVIHNQSKGFSYYVIEVLISRSSDIGKALDVMRASGDEVRNDPAFTPLMLDAIEIAGVDKLSDAGIALKARIKTAPGMQWRVGRDYLRRLKLALDAANIETPVPSLKLAMMDQPLPPPNGGSRS